MLPDNVLFEGGAGEKLRRRLLHDFGTTCETNQQLTLKQNPLRRADLDDFVVCYAPEQPRSERIESERLRAFTDDELVARDTANLDMTWLRDQSVEDLDNLPAPEVIARRDR